MGDEDSRKSSEKIKERKSESQRENHEGIHDEMTRLDVHTHVVHTRNTEKTIYHVLRGVTLKS